MSKQDDSKNEKSVGGLRSLLIFYRTIGLLLFLLVLVCVYSISTLEDDEETAYRLLSAIMFSAFVFGVVFLFNRPRRRRDQVDPNLLR